MYGTIRDLPSSPKTTEPIPPYPYIAHWTFSYMFGWLFLPSSSPSVPPRCHQRLLHSPFHPLPLACRTLHYLYIYACEHGELFKLIVYFIIYLSYIPIYKNTLLLCRVSCFPIFFLIFFKFLGVYNGALQAI